jgi:hypothetical protein
VEGLAPPRHAPQDKQTIPTTTWGRKGECRRRFDTAADRGENFGAAATLASGRIHLAHKRDGHGCAMGEAAPSGVGSVLSQAREGKEGTRARGAVSATHLVDARRRRRHPARPPSTLVSEKRAGVSATPEVCQRDRSARAPRRVGARRFVSGRRCAPPLPPGRTGRGARSGRRWPRPGSRRGVGGGGAGRRRGARAPRPRLGERLKRGRWRRGAGTGRPRGAPGPAGTPSRTRARLGEGVGASARARAARVRRATRAPFPPSPALSRLGQLVYCSIPTACHPSAGAG